jgi:GNAT superfamily N-acetyltransferase
MQTLFLGREQIAAYLRDLERRLLDLGSQKPNVWVPLGFSGTVLLREIFKVAEKLNKSSTIVIVANCRRDSKTRRIKITWGNKHSRVVPVEQFKGKNVIVVDSAVHSGRTMAATIRSIKDADAAGVCSYSLVLKESSALIPSYWAVSIGDEDRAYLLLDSIPNNRLVRPVASADDDGVDEGFGNALTEGIKGRLPYFTVRKLSHDDISKPKFKVRLASLNRSTWPDLYYEMRNSDRVDTYVLEIGADIVGYITMELPEEKELSIEQVAVSHRHKGKGYGAALLRWAETRGRLKDCTHIRLWAFTEREGWYCGHGFRRTGDGPMDLGDEKYVRMRKCLLPHTGCCANTTPVAGTASAKH